MNPEPLSPPEPAVKYSELVDVWLQPVYRSLARRIPPWVTPNQITLSGLVINTGNALLLVTLPQRWVLLLVIPLVYAATVLDSLDGLHARATRQTSTFGKFLDLFCDALSNTLVTLALMQRFGLMQWFFVAAVLLRLFGYFTAALCLACTGELYIPPFGVTFETLFMGAVLVTAYCVNDTLAPAAWLPSWMCAKATGGAVIWSYAMYLYWVICPLATAEYVARTWRFSQQSGAFTAQVAS